MASRKTRTGTTVASRRMPATLVLPGSHLLPGTVEEIGGPHPYPTWRGQARTAAAARMAAIAMIPVAWAPPSARSSRLGAATILEASPWIGGFDDETGLDPLSQGIFTTTPIEEGDGREIARRVEAVVAQALSGDRLPVVLGGDRIGALGAVRAQAATGEPFGVVMIDAHRHIQEEGTHYGPLTNWFAAGVCRAQVPMVMVGHRGMVEVEAEALARSPLPQMPARRIASMDPARACVEALRHLPPRIQLSIDLSVLDPGQFPAVELPLPYGVTFDWLTNFVRLLASSREVVGVDLCGYSPHAGPPACASMAAGFLNRLLAVLVKTGSVRRRVEVPRR